MNKKALTMFQQTVKFEQEYIWVKPICDFFEISYKWQAEVIRRDHILPSTVRKSCNEKLFGDKRNRISLSKYGFIRWIQAINPNTVKDSLQEKFKQYQKLVFDFLFGSIAQNKETKMLYTRLKKLKRLKSMVNGEIRTVKERLDEQLSQRFLQTSIPFKKMKGPNNQ